METKESEDKSLSCLKNDLMQVIFTQFELNLAKGKKNLKTEKKKLNHMSSQLHMTKQHIEFYTQENQRALEGAKDSN